VPESDEYNKYYQIVRDEKMRRNEDAWFRKALKESLITEIAKGVPNTLPVEFFFPEDRPAPPAPSAPGAAKSAAGAKGI
jgi:hypothetical protein